MDQATGDDLEAAGGTIRCAMEAIAGPIKDLSEWAWRGPVVERNLKPENARHRCGNEGGTAEEILSLFNDRTVKAELIKPFHGGLHSWIRWLMLITFSRLYLQLNCRLQGGSISSSFNLNLTKANLSKDSGAKPPV